MNVLEDVEVVRRRHHVRQDYLYLFRSLTNVTLPGGVGVILTLDEVSKVRLITTTIQSATLLSLIDLLEQKAFITSDKHQIFFINYKKLTSQQNSSRFSLLVISVTELYFWYIYFIKLI